MAAEWVLAVDSGTMFTVAAAREAGRRPAGRRRLSRWPTTLRSPPPSTGMSRAICSSARRSRLAHPPPAGRSAPPKSRSGRGPCSAARQSTTSTWSPPARGWIVDGGQALGAPGTLGTWQPASPGGILRLRHRGLHACVESRGGRTPVCSLSRRRDWRSRSSSSRRGRAGPRPDRPTRRPSPAGMRSTLPALAHTSGPGVTALYLSRGTRDTERKTVSGGVRLSEGRVMSGCFGHAMSPRAAMLSGS
jgi:hypothetical protein